MITCYTCKGCYCCDDQHGTAQKEAFENPDDNIVIQEENQSQKKSLIKVHSQYTVVLK